MRVRLHEYRVLVPVLVHRTFGDCNLVLVLVMPVVVTVCVVVVDCFVAMVVLVTATSGV